MTSDFYVGVVKKESIFPIRNLTKKELIEYFSKESPLDPGPVFKDNFLTDELLFSELTNLGTKIFLKKGYIWEEDMEQVRMFGRPLFRDFDLLHGISGKSYPYVLEKEGQDKVKELFHIDFSLDKEQETLLFWCI